MGRSLLTDNEYNELLRAQDGRCAICRAEPDECRALAVDHDHITGKVRGLLCARCNLGLGYMRDDPELLQRSAAYVVEHGVRPLPAEQQTNLADYCRRCRNADHTDFNIHLPFAYIVDDETRWVTAAYRCPQRHAWTCGWSDEFLLRGVPTTPGAPTG